MAEDKWPEKILSSFVEEFRADVAYNMSPRAHSWSACESPIERAFAISFAMVHGYVYGKPLLTDTYSIGADAPQMFLIPQFVAGDYRVDFLIGWNIGEHRSTSLVVECDGHDFHEKTKQQAARDKARDRYLSSRFAKVIRFTGSELFKSPSGCAVEAQGFADDLFWTWYQRGRGP